MMTPMRGTLPAFSQGDAMEAEDIRRSAFAMPISSPSFPRGPYRYVGREHLTITYETDPAALARVTPEPLVPLGPFAKIEFARIEDSTGFGRYCGMAQIIPVALAGETGGYTHRMFLDSYAPISGGRELWGFPQKLGKAQLSVERDALVGGLTLGAVQVATATMGYKHAVADEADAALDLAAPGFLLKIMPHVDGRPRICELVRVRRSGIVLRGAWTGPAALDLRSHALARLADLPVRRVVSAQHLIADFTLDLGAVVHDYMTGAAR